MGGTETFRDLWHNQPMFKEIIAECRDLCEGLTKEQQRAGLEATWARRPYADTQRHGNDPDISTKRKATRANWDGTSHKISLKKRIDADPQGTHDREGYKYPAEYGNIHKLPYAQRRLNDYEGPGGPQVPKATAKLKKPSFLSKLASMFKR